MHQKLFVSFFSRVGFCKRFWSIDWSFLLKVLQARGFDDRCSWILSLLSSGFSIVLVNDQPITLSDVNVDWDRGTPFAVSIYTWGRFSITHTEACVWRGLVQKLDLGTRGFRACNMLMTLSYFYPRTSSLSRGLIYWYIFELLSGFSINFHKSSIYQLRP